MSSFVALKSENIFENFQWLHNEEKNNSFLNNQLREENGGTSLIQWRGTVSLSFIPFWLRNLCGNETKKMGGQIELAIHKAAERPQKHSQTAIHSLSTSKFHLETVRASAV